MADDTKKEIPKNYRKSRSVLITIQENALKSRYIKWHVSKLEM